VQTWRNPRPCKTAPTQVVPTDGYEQQTVFCAVKHSFPSGRVAESNGAAPALGEGTAVGAGVASHTRARPAVPTGGTSPSSWALNIRATANPSPDLLPL
jgi:hypothetical protein